MTIHDYGLTAGLAFIILVSIIPIRCWIGSYLEARTALPRPTVRISFLQAYRTFRSHRQYSVWDAIQYAMWLKNYPLHCMYMHKLAKQAETIARRG